MCGHGTIGLVATLRTWAAFSRPCDRDSGWHCQRGIAWRRRSHRAQRTELPLCERCNGRGEGLWTDRGDVAWGGNWFFLAKSESPVELSVAQAGRVDNSPGASGRRLAPGNHRRERYEIDHIEIFQHRVTGTQPQLRALPRQELRSLALRHRHQRENGLLVCRRSAATRRCMEAGKHHGKRI